LLHRDELAVQTLQLGLVLLRLHPLRHRQPSPCTRRRYHFAASTTTGSTSASPIAISHCGPVSGWVSMPDWRLGSCGARKIIVIGTSDTPSAFSSGGASPLAGSRRLVIALPTVPRPITTNVMVSDALGCVVLGSSGPATSARNAAVANTTP